MKKEPTGWQSCIIWGWASYEAVGRAASDAGGTSQDDLMKGLLWKALRTGVPHGPPGWRSSWSTREISSLSPRFCSSVCFFSFFFPCFFLPLFLFLFPLFFPFSSFPSCRHFPFLFSTLRTQSLLSSWPPHLFVPRLPVPCSFCCPPVHARPELSILFLLCKLSLLVPFLFFLAPPSLASIFLPALLLRRLLCLFQLLLVLRFLLSQLFMVCDMLRGRTYTL